MLWFLRALEFATCLGSGVHHFLALQADSKGDIATMIALQGLLKFNGGGAARGFLSSGDVFTNVSLLYSVHARAGHVNHSIFWTNLLPPKVLPLPLCATIHTGMACFPVQAC